MLKITPTQSAKNLPSDITENVGVGSKTSSTTKSAKNSSLSRIWLSMLRLLAIVMVVIMKRSKDHLFPRSQTYLRSILPSYALTLIVYFSKKMRSPDNSNHCWGSQLKTLYKRLQNKAVVRSAGPISFLDAMLHWLSSYDLWAFSIPFSGTSSLSLTLLHKCLTENTQLYRRLAYQTFFYFSKPICLSIRSLSVELMFSLKLR